MNASVTPAPPPRGFWVNWSGPILVLSLLAMSLTMAITAVVLLTAGKGREGDREIPHAYERSLKEAAASRGGSALADQPMARPER